MSLLNFKIEILKNFHFQNKLLFKQTKDIIENNIYLKNIYQLFNEYNQNLIVQNRLLFCVIILQIFILFK